jgi:hypothetical protein
LVTSILRSSEGNERDCAELNINLEVDHEMIIDLHYFASPVARAALMHILGKAPTQESLVNSSIEPCRNS